MTSADLAYLIDDVELALESEDFVALYEFSWTLRGRNKALTEAEIEVLCQQAYDDAVARRSLRLMWLDWPPGPSAGRVVEVGTPLDFDINSTGTPSVPLLALVAADVLRPAPSTAEFGTAVEVHYREGGDEVV